MAPSKREMIDGAVIEPFRVSGSEPASTQGGASLTLGSVIEPRWGSGGEALLKTGRLHNKRLHTEATSPIHYPATCGFYRWQVWDHS